MDKTNIIIKPTPTLMKPITDRRKLLRNFCS